MAHTKMVHLILAYKKQHATFVLWQNVGIPTFLTI